MKKTAVLIITLFTALFFVFPVMGSSQLPDVYSETQETSESVQENSNPGKVSGVSVKEATSSAITFGWNKAENADGYNIYVFNSKSKKYKFLETVGNTVYTAENLKPATVYSFKIAAVKMIGEEKVKGEASEAFAAVTAPKKITELSSGDIGKDYITLTWTASKGAAYYEIQIFSKEEEKFTDCGISRDCSIKIDGLSDNCVYSFRVRPCAEAEGVIAFGEYTSLSEFTDTDTMPHTKAQAVKIYNTAVNGAKNTQNMTVGYTKSISTKTISCSKKSLFNTVSNMMNLFAGEMKKSYSFENGTDGEIAPISLIEPSDKLSAMKGSDIYSFSASYGEKGYVLTLKLKSEITAYEKKKTETPIHASGVSQTIALNKLKVSPLKIKSAASFFDGADVRLTLYDDGKAKKLKIKNPVTVEADCRVSTLDFTTKVGYTVNEAYTFKYTEIK